MTRSSAEKEGIRYDSQFLRIEELIKGKTFSREEISHLVAMLNSRVDTELEKKSERYARGDTEQVVWTHEIPTTPAGDMYHVIDRTPSGTIHEKSDVSVGVGASPIDIARAYMAGRTSEQGHDLHNYISKGERAEPSNKFSQQPPVASPLPKPSICWPGAVLNDHHGYSTPQSQGSRYGLRGFPRTPYARTITSRSTTKLHANSRLANTSTPFQQSPTSIYGQVKSRADSVDVYRSVGPIRRIRNKFALEVHPGESEILSSSKDAPSDKINSNFLSGFLPTTEKILEPGETSGTLKCLSDASGFSDKVVPNATSTAVKKILEFLDRNKPTPKEKEDEIKLVNEWNEFPSKASETIHVIKKAGLSGLNFPMEINNSSNGSNNLVKIYDKGMDVAAPIKVNPGANSEASSGPVVKNSNENAFVTTSHGQEKNVHFSWTHLGNGPDIKDFANSTDSGLSKNHGTKPSLSSIFIKKPEIHDVNSGNGPGFTFPVCTATGVLSEPPTPSILPSASSTPQPTYSFGTNKSNPSLVFSFPCTSNASVNDSSDLKFSFGSDKRTRLSFSSFDTDAICY